MRGYVFAWPLLFGSLGWAWVFVADPRGGSRARWALLVGPAVAALLLVVPVLALAYTGGGMAAPGALAAIVALLLGMLVPPLDALFGPGR